MHRFRTAVLSLGLLFLSGADVPPPALPLPIGQTVTTDELKEANEAAQKAIRVAQLKLELYRQQSGSVSPVVNVTAPPAVVNVAPAPAESDTSVVIKQIRDAVVPAFLLALTAFIGVVASNIPAARDALNSWIQLKLTAHQQARVYAAADTAAGQIETKLDRKALTVGDITEDSPKVREIVADALRQVQESAKAQGANVDTVTPIVIARVDTGSRVQTSKT